MKKIAKILTVNILSNKIKRYLFPLAVIISIVFPLFISFRNIDNMPFWFDSARDFLLAQDNLKKFSLIGPPTGIPGLFYGPYWIWLISLGLIFSKDPRFVVIYLLIIPYLVVFPLLLSRFARIFSKEICLMLWILFITAYINYTTYLWNPHLSPILFLLLFVLIVFNKLSITNRKTNVIIFLIGLVNGLILNFHISLGIGILIATFLFFILEFIVSPGQTPKEYILNRIRVILLWFQGVVITFLPFIIFELRHDFLQVKSIKETVIKAIFYNMASVGQTGFKQTDILYKFFIREPVELLKIPTNLIYLIYLILFGIVFFSIKKKEIKFNHFEKRLILFLFLSGLSILSLYLSSKNPVWDYHFIGVEIIFLFSIGFIIYKINIFKRLLAVWTSVILLSFVYSRIIFSNINPHSFSSVETKKYIVNKICQDANKNQFTVFAYSPAIYTFDYDYIFKWQASIDPFCKPETDAKKSQFTYLIIPETIEANKLDFIDYKTPNSKFTTVSTWAIEDKTLIIKRVKK